jgi:hypothetical protein
MDGADNASEPEVASSKYHGFELQTLCIEHVMRFQGRQTKERPILLADILVGNEQHCRRNAKEVFESKPQEIQMFFLHILSPRIEFQSRFEREK